MESIKIPFGEKEIILALGAESAGIFAVCINGKVFISENFGDLLDENNFLKYKKAISEYLKKERVKLDVVLSDLHPLFKTTVLGEDLAKKFKAKHVKIQHHFAHIFSAIGDRLLDAKKWPINSNFIGIAMDGTGFGLDENIWGGEAFQIKSEKLKIKNDNLKCKISKTQNLKIERIGSLEEQVMIGGDLAVKEPARMLISILAKFMPKKNIYQYIKKYYSKNEFEALYSQLEQNFNCQTTTSTGRILDAVSVLLGFSGNERNFKHEAVKKLEQNSGIPYSDLEIKIIDKGLRQVLNTGRLFEYLIKNTNKDRRRLAATAQLYIAKGLYEIAKGHESKIGILAAGGMANNKIISTFFAYHGIYLAKKIPRGDEGIALGQIVYYLLK